ncbi:MAG: hypothetical protein Q8K62_03475 [Thiobacillus sp.]|nr:hypothetical protein [Thiobacillus sp.]
MSKVALADLVKRRGGRIASALGIDLAAPDAGERASRFTDFESALVREGLHLRHTGT